MSDEGEGLPFPFKGEGTASYKKENLLHIARLETDTAEQCKPKLIRKRRWFFGEKVVVFHWRGGDDYYINEIK
jgi:hypothetical protein